MPVLANKKHGRSQATADGLRTPTAVRKGPLSFASVAAGSNAPARSAATSQAPARPAATSQAPGRRPESNLPADGSGELPGISKRFGGMSINAINTHSPSMAPTPKLIPSRPRNNFARSYAPTARTNRTRFTTRGPPPMIPRNGEEWTHTAECIKSPFGSHDFSVGHVISVPFTVNNMNKDAKFEEKDKNGHRPLTTTAHGPVYTKRRMFVILFKYRDGMYCLPLYSFNSRGIEAKATPFDIRDHYVCLKDRTHENFRAGGPNAPIEFDHSDPTDQLDRESTIHLSGGMRIYWKEYIGLIGKITDQGYELLLDQWSVLQKKAVNGQDV